jgi:signal transduction histidine kinase
MARKRSLPILASYVASILFTIVLLVLFVVYSTRASARLDELARVSGVRLAAAEAEPPWTLIAIGSVLFFLVLVGLTYQLAENFAARRYAAKQEEFVASITHELKSPLAAIQLHAQTLEQLDLSAADRARSLHFIREQVERMGKLVDNILESSRLVRRKVRLDLEPVALGAFLGRFAEEARHQYPPQGIRLRFEGSTDARVMATTEALRRVLGNLLDNAVRFSKPGGEVRCLVADRGPVVEVVVEDDGIGIPENELRKVFDRFYQIRREFGGRERGTGLGLSIVSGLVKEMRGSVRAETRPGRPGTTFVVTLPRLPAEPAA